MSILQRALDRAENPEKETVTAPEPQVKTPVPALAVKKTEAPAERQHQAPRLNTIRFYESQNEAVEEDIQETARAAFRNYTAAQKETKRPRKNFLGLILVLLLLTVGAAKLVIPSKPEKTPANTLAPASSAPSEAVVVKAQKPFTSVPVSQIKFILTGITASGDTTLAVINNQVVGTGDKLREGAVVKSITANRVVLDLDGRQIVLNF